MTITSDLATHVREQHEGLRPPPKKRTIAPTTKRGRTNRKAQIKRAHGDQLPEYERYLLDRLELVRELMRRDGNGRQD